MHKAYPQPKETATPAQIFISAKQLEAIVEAAEDHDIVVTETFQTAQAIDVWVCDTPSLEGNTHRSVVINDEGEVLSDSTMPDD